MRVIVLLLLTLVLFQSTDPTRIRLLLRDESGAGVAGAALTLRRDDGATIDLRTNGDGVAVSDGLPGGAVWLVGGQRADGTPLVADSAPGDAGFRLVLLPGQVRDALLRLDGDLLVLDPAMIFTADTSAATPTIAALAAPVPPPGAPVVADAAPVVVAGVSPVMWCLLVGGVLLLAGAIVVARMRVQQQRQQ